MKSIGELDAALNVRDSFGREDVALFDPREKPFTLYELIYENGQYRRMPEQVAATVSDGVRELSAYTAGGRVAFRTDSDFVAISCRRPALWRMPHMALIASAGFDLWTREDGVFRYAGSFMPNQNGDGYESLVKFETHKEREVLIHFPLYCPISSLLIGVQTGANVSEWSGYSHQKPIVFYGSSITQGACASIPGNDYIGRVSRHFNADYRNLGFSGNAKGEEAMMRYLAGLEMSAFVYDYDHNSPNAEHLQNTHERGYRIIREAHPDLPIVMMSCPNFDDPHRAAKPRRDVIAATYEKALAEGDKHVAFIDGERVFATFVADGCTVDGSHPNDLGFDRMAKEVIGALTPFFG